MAFLVKPLNKFVPYLMQTRSVTGRCRIGNRDVVGFGKSGAYYYDDDPMWPYPAIRFKDNTPDVCALRQKEKGDWKQLSCEEKKALYRASFCMTFAEMLAPTGKWKFIAGIVLIAASYAFWMFLFMHEFVYGPLPPSLSLESRQAQLRRMFDIRVNPIDGISSKWDYDKDDWKQ